MKLLNLIFLIPFAVGQEGNHGEQIFELPRAPQDALRPKINKDLASYFQLTGPYSNLFDVILGPRPGFVPQRNFEVVEFDPADPRYRYHQPVQGTLPLAPRENPNAESGFVQDDLTPEQQEAARQDLNQILPGLAQSGQGQVPFSFDREGNGKLSISNQPAGFAGSPNFVPQQNRGPNPNAARRFSGAAGSSSVRGIPRVFPTLPRAPIPQAIQLQPQPQQQPSVVGQIPQFPQLSERPNVPQGGLGPLSLNEAPRDLQTILQDAQSSRDQPSQFPATNLGIPGFSGPGSSSLPASLHSKTGVLDSVLDAFGFGGQKAAAAPQAGFGLGGPQLDSKGLDLSGINNLLGLNGQNTGVLSSVIYNALTDSAVQSVTKQNETIAVPKQPEAKDIASYLPTAGLQQNIALIQNLLTQPSSPLCVPKPVPVQQMDIDAFMGTWYQVLYSPPMSSGPCSMVSYRKLSDVGAGGPGTVFDTFEYMTEGSHTGPPRISSGYSIIKGPGQLIYRTTSSATDVNVNVLSLGPINSDGQYEYVVLAVNCNYPLHVYARDPIRYKQKYEVDVAAEMERRGLTNGFSRLLNIVANVDNTLCKFPPNLFNIRS